MPDLTTDTTEYTLKLTTETGRFLYEIPTFSLLNWVGAVNTIGWFSLAFDAGEYPRNLFQLDQRIELWRSPEGRATDLAGVFFMRVYQEQGDGYLYTADYGDELTYVYAAGSGKESARVLTYASNATRLAASLLNRREGLYENTNTDDTDLLEDGAKGLLYEQRPQIKFRRDIGSMKPYTFGPDWKLGDVVRIAGGRAPARIIISGPDLNDLLDRRIIGYKSGTSEAAKEAEADDMLKAYVEENLGSSAGSGRVLPTEMGFVIDSDKSAAPSVKHAAAFGKLFGALQRIAEKSAEKGTVLRFGIRPVLVGGQVIPRFETRVGQWGQDRTYLQFGAGPRAFDMEIRSVSGRVERKGTRYVEKIEARPEYTG